MKNQRKNLRNVAAISGAILGGTLIGVNPLNASTGSIFESSDLGTGSEIRSGLLDMNKAAIAAEGSSIIKFSELKCGEGKCGEGKCGEDKKKDKKADETTETKAKTEKTKSTDAKTEKAVEKTTSKTDTKKEAPTETSGDGK